MARESKGGVKKSVAVDPNTYAWVTDFAKEHGMDYTAAVNYLLVEARKEIERMERLKTDTANMGRE